MRDRFEQQLPGAFFLQPDDPEGLSAYLVERGWLDAGERITWIGRAGEGNMNLALRVRTPERSLIVKQGRPWVEKYPDIPAPLERARVEAAFYRAVSDVPAVAERMPALVGADPDARVLVLEDLGEAADYTDCYGGAELERSELTGLMSWLAALHTMDAPRDPLFENRGMRQLNHTHIFALPLEPGALDRDAFTPGLQAVAETLIADRTYTSRVAELGERYLGGGEHLLHGDYYPGSWLRTAEGSRIIDPEFCFVGPAEFDAGVYLAHLVFTGWSADDAESALFDTYPPALDADLVRGFAGAELMRRLLGVAQLPLEADLEMKKDWLSVSRRWVLG